MTNQPRPAKPAGWLVFARADPMIDEMRDKLARKLADPELYEDVKAGELAVWNKKYAEGMEALDRAEALWMSALEKLETAQAA